MIYYNCLINKSGKSSGNIRYHWNRSDEYISSSRSSSLFYGCLTIHIRVASLRLDLSKSDRLCNGNVYQRCLLPRFLDAKSPCSWTPKILTRHKHSFQRMWIGRKIDRLHPCRIQMTVCVSSRWRTRPFLDQNEILTTISYYIKN